jgi:hypothetical protein
MKQVFFIIATLFIISCSNDESKNFDLNDVKSIESKNYDELFSSIVQKKSTSGLTSGLLDIGVFELNCTLEENKITYKLNSIPELFLNSKTINLNNLEFVLENDVFYEVSNPELFISKRGNQFYLNEVLFEELNLNSNHDINSFLLLSVFNDITSNIDRADGLVFSRRACDVSDQVVVVGWGMSSGGANADLQATINQQQSLGNLDCTPLDSKPKENSYGIFNTASMSFCCDGRGGAGGSW